MFQKATTFEKLKTFLASAQNHLLNEAERCRVSRCAKYVEQLRSLGNSTTSNILSTFHNMHTMMCNSTTPRVVVHISSFSVSSSALGEVNTAIIARRHHTCAQLCALIEPIDHDHSVSGCERIANDSQHAICDNGTSITDFLIHSFHVSLYISLAQVLCESISHCMCLWLQRCPV